MIGLTALLIIATPELMAGFSLNSMPGGIVSLLGIRLKMLSIEKGRISLTATIAQSKHKILFGAFLRNGRMMMIAKISQLAAMLIFNIFKKISLIFSPPF